MLRAVAPADPADPADPANPADPADPAVTVSLYGAGQVGAAAAALLTSRPGIEVLGLFDRDARSEALTSGATVVVIATTSFLREVAPDIRDAVDAGSNVITTAEEAAFPAAVNPRLANELARLAIERGVTILGAGLNPGFAFDALTLTAMGPAATVSSVRVARVVDLSGFSAAVLRRIGIGYTSDEFEAGTFAGTITGHIGFPQSMHVVAGRLGLTIERIERRIEPIIATGDYVGAQLAVSAGLTAGFEQRYAAVVDGSEWFVAEFLGHLDPASHGVAPRDEISIEGAASVHLVIDPGLHPQVAAPALVANSVRRVADAAPGWLTVGDLPPACPV